MPTQNCFRYWRGVVVHHTAGKDTSGVDTDGIRRYHTEERGWQDIGYHWLVERVDGRYQAIMGRPMNVRGSHCKGSNRTHLGVALVGDFTDAPPLDEQLQVGAQLIAGLCASLFIPVEEVKMHRELRDTECPGDSFPFDELIAKVRVLLGN